MSAKIPPSTKILSVYNSRGQKAGLAKKSRHLFHNARVFKQFIIERASCSYKRRAFWDNRGTGAPPGKDMNITRGGVGAPLIKRSGEASLYTFMNISMTAGFASTNGCNKTQKLVSTGLLTNT